MSERQSGFLRRAHNFIVTEGPDYLRFGSLGMGIAAGLNSDLPVIGMSVLVHVGSTAVIIMDKRMSQKLRSIDKKR